MWINTDSIAISIEGQPGFLVEIYPQGKAIRYQLRDEPACQNISGIAKLTGWCGETNNVSVIARGIWKPIKRSPSGLRTFIERITEPEKIAAYLEAVGYPDLIP